MVRPRHAPASRVVLAMALGLTFASAGCARVVSVPDEEDSGDPWDFDSDFPEPFPDDEDVPFHKEDPDVPLIMKGDDAGAGPTDAGTPVTDRGSVPRDTGPVTPTTDAGSATCGRLGRACCASSRCNSGLNCAGTVCVEMPTCGAVGQPCCGTAACGPGLTCESRVCTATRTCGASGQGCCTGSTSCLALMACVSGRCVPCGNVGQACCTGTPTCSGSGVMCGGGWCRY